MDSNPNNCLICGRVDKAKPMAFRGEVWCSDRHRKVFNAELMPTKAEIEAMDLEVLHRLDEHWVKRGLPLPGWDDGREEPTLGTAPLPHMFLDKDTLQPCPRDGVRLCTINDKDHRHIARNTLSRGEMIDAEWT